MDTTALPYRIFSLGDAAISIDFGNQINEKINEEVIARFRQLQEHPIPGMIEAIPAYASLTIYYDIPRIKKNIPANILVYDWIKQQVEQRMQLPTGSTVSNERLMRIPVCYDAEKAPDLQHLASIKKISIEEIIHIHVSGIYKVYMLGFLPGFPYMGELDEQIVMPRKPQPVPVKAGSVGIAGKQTGIYPLASPGGWTIIGQTPLKLFRAENKEPALLRAGDRVQFYPITKQEFESY